MNIILSCVLPIMCVWTLSLGNALFWKKEIEETISFSLLESVFLLFLCGFWDLRIGVALYICVLVACLVYSLYEMYQIGVDTVAKKAITPYMLCFVFVYLYVFVINHGKAFSHWDEVSHWGIMAKDFFYNNHYYFFDDAKLTVHNEYPPLTTLLGYLWCKLSLGYSESYLYTGKIIFGLSLLIPVIKGERTRRVYPYLDMLLVLVLPICVIVGEASFYRTIYADSLLAIVALACVCDVMQDDESTYGVIRTTLLLFALIMTKQIAIIIYAFIALIWIGLLISKRNGYDKKEERLAYIFKLGVPLFTFGIWKLVTKMHCSDGQFDVSTKDIYGIISVFQGNDTTYRTEVLHNFLRNLWMANLPLGRIHMSYVSMGVFLLILAIIVSISSRCKVYRYASTIWIIFAMYITYAMVMLFSYLYGFSESEAMNLACYDRYMNTMVFVAFGVSFVVLYNLLLNIFPTKILLIESIIIICVCIFVAPSSYVNELMLGKSYESSGEIYEGDSGYIIENTEEESKIFVIYQGANASARNWMAYLSYPREFSERNYSVCVEKRQDDNYDFEIMPQELLGNISEFDYLYLGNVDSRFVDDYGMLFSDINQVRNQALFKVINDDDVVELQYMGCK